MPRGSPKKVAGAALLSLLTACATPAAPPPSHPRDRSTFQAWRLSYEAGQFRRKDGQYSAEQVVGLAKECPDAVALVQVGAGSTAASILGSISGALVGATLGHQLTADRDTKLSGGAQAGLYGTAAGLFVLGVVFAVASKPKVDGEAFAEAYNSCLRSELGLSRVRKTSRVRRRILRASDAVEAEDQVIDVEPTVTSTAPPPPPPPTRRVFRPEPR